jgi:hypothetical protein
MGEPLYGFQTPNGYSDTAESWVNTGGLLERLNFGLMLASNHIPGTRVDLKQFLPTGDRSVDNRQMMDRFLEVIVAGETSEKTKQALLKQLDEQAPLVVSASTAQRANAGMSGEPMSSMDAPDMLAPQSLRPRQQRQLAARQDANITDPVTKIVGLILGSPEFQRQ